MWDNACEGTWTQTHSNKQPNFVLMHSHPLLHICSGWSVAVSSTETRAGCWDYIHKCSKVRDLLHVVNRLSAQQQVISVSHLQFQHARLATADAIWWLNYGNLHKEQRSTNQHITLMNTVINNLCINRNFLCKLNSSMMYLLTGESLPSPTPKHTTWPAPSLTTVADVAILTLSYFTSPLIAALGEWQESDIWCHQKQQHQNKLNKVILKLLLKPYFDRKQPQ